MPTDATVREALSTVIDPEIRRPLTELDMVREVNISGGVVDVLIALTIPGCPLKQKIEGDVRAAVGRVDGVSSVGVRFTHMSDTERSALSTRLRGERGQSDTKELRVGPRTRVIAMCSGKGGVGKSSLACNLAVALSQQGHEVGLIDADIYGFSIPGMMGIQQRPVALDGLIVPPVAHDVRTMSIGYFLEEEGAVMWRGPMLHKALEQFLSDVHWGDLDFLVVDMPPGTGDVAISLGQLLGQRAEAFIITTPNPTAQRVAERAAAVSHRLKMPVRGIIENMSHRICPCCGERDDIFGAGGGQALADKINVPLLVEIPLETTIRQGGDDGLPGVISAPDSPAAQAIQALARQIVGMKGSDPVQRMTRRLEVVQRG